MLVSNAGLERFLHQSFGAQTRGLWAGEDVPLLILNYHCIAPIRAGLSSRRSASVQNRRPSCCRRK
jgi:hypothetical protein